MGSHMTWEIDASRSDRCKYAVWAWGLEGTLMCHHPRVGDTKRCNFANCPLKVTGNLEYRGEK